MNTRDQFRASHAIGTLIKFMETPRADFLDREREAIETLIELVEAAAAPPLPEADVTNFYKEN